MPKTVVRGQATGPSNLVATHSVYAWIILSLAVRIKNKKQSNTISVTTDISSRFQLPWVPSIVYSLSKVEENTYNGVAQPLADNRQL